MKDIDGHHWAKAMKFELDSMYSNQVWDLVKTPNGIKPVGCKWVYKRKFGNDYMNDCTPKSRVINDEIRNDVVVSDTSQYIAHKMTSTQEPHRSGRIIRPLVRFIGLGETYEAISEEAKIDPYTYEEAMNTIDAHHWVKNYEI